MAYGDDGHEDELLAWEARELEDERLGLFQGDPRHCKSHPEIQTSSRDGMFDGLCWKCEQAADGAYDDEKEHSMETRAQRLRRKADQAWELAGCARVDRDAKDEARWTAEAREYERQLTEEKAR